MHFVDRDRRVEVSLLFRGACAVCGSSQTTTPSTGAVRRQSHRVGLERKDMARPERDLVPLIAAPTPGMKIPRPAFAAQAHRMAPAVPGVEVADDADALGVRRPDGEGGALDAIDLRRCAPRRSKGRRCEPSASSQTSIRRVPSGNGRGRRLPARRPAIQCAGGRKPPVAAEDGSLEKPEVRRVRRSCARQFDDDLAVLGSIALRDGVGAGLQAAQPQASLASRRQAEYGTANGSPCSPGRGRDFFLLSMSDLS